MDAPSAKSPAENPYAAPASRPVAPGGIPDWKRSGKTSLALLGSSVGIWAATLAVLSPDRHRALGEALFVLSGVLASCACVFAWRTGQLARRSLAPVSAGFVTLVAVSGVGSFFMAGIGFFTALFASASFSRGRQLRRRGKVLLPSIENENGSWAQQKFETTVPAEDRAALAAAWRENGRTEHASVAAFARLTIDLMALGAPPELVAHSNRDALDEIRHTELCFSLARSMDGKAASPAPFPAAQTARTLSENRTMAFAELAVDSMIDGALHEGVSARIVAKLVRRCESAEIRAVLKEIAADEGRHAAHGWDVVEWCLEEGGASVARALLGALVALPRSMHADLPNEAESGAWEKYGIMGRDLEDDEYAAARADLAHRMTRMISPYLNSDASSSTIHTLPSDAVTTAAPKRSSSGESKFSRWEGLA